MERCDLAVERKHRLGCNCCQAVLLAFAPEIGQRWCGDGKNSGEGGAAGLLQDEGLEDALMALGSGIGAGMGGMDATCGALVGAGMVVGLLNGNAAADGEDARSTMPTVLKTRRLCAEFKEKVGALRCADIKGVQTKKVLCSCDNCVRYAIQFAEKYIDLE